MDEFDEEPKKQEGIYVLGQNVLAIPCFRDTGILSCSVGIGSSLLSFLFTSNGLKATNVGFWTFMAVALPYWFFCNHKYYTHALELREVQKSIQAKTRDEYEILDSLEGIQSETAY